MQTSLQRTSFEWTTARARMEQMWSLPDKTSHFNGLIWSFQSPRDQHCAQVYQKRLIRTRNVDHADQKKSRHDGNAKTMEPIWAVILNHKGRFRSGPVLPLILDQLTDPVAHWSDQRWAPQTALRSKPLRFNRKP